MADLISKFSNIAGAGVDFLYVYVHSRIFSSKSPLSKSFLKRFWSAYVDRQSVRLSLSYDEKVSLSCLEYGHTLSNLVKCASYGDLNSPLPKNWSAGCTLLTRSSWGPSWQRSNYLFVSSQASMEIRDRKVEQILILFGIVFGSTTRTIMIDSISLLLKWLFWNVWRLFLRLERIHIGRLLTQAHSKCSKCDDVSLSRVEFRF